MKILIIGNTGSGKTTLAKIIANKLNYKITCHLDQVFWNDDHSSMRPRLEQNKILNSILMEENSVIEGVYKTICDRILSKIDVLIYLDIDLNTCLNHVEIRGSGDINKVKSYYCKTRIFKGNKIYCQGYHSNLIKSFHGHKFVLNDNNYDELISNLQKLQYNGCK